MFLFFLVFLTVVLDYAKFDRIKEDGSGVSEKESSSVSKKPSWAPFVEKKEVSKLKAMLDKGEIDLKSRWTGERHRWTTPGNFQDESEYGTYTPLGCEE